MKYTRTIIKNGALVTFRKENNLTCKAMSELCGVRNTTYCSLESLKTLPISKNGTWSKDAKRISSVVGQPEEELFPEAFEYITQLRFEKEAGTELVSSESIRMCLPPSEAFEIEMLGKYIEAVLVELKESEQLIIKHRFGLLGEEKTLDETAELMHLSRTQVKDIEARALRKLRWPKRLDALMTYLQGKEHHGIAETCTYCRKPKRNMKLCPECCKPICDACSKKKRCT